jgi:hypothetical protein
MKRIELDIRQGDKIKSSYLDPQWDEQYVRDCLKKLQEDLFNLWKDSQNDTLETVRR